MNPLQVVRLGQVPYGQGLALQLRLREALQADDSQTGWLLMLEHTPTVTLGKRGTLEHLVSRHTLDERGIEVFRIDRGGEATVHNPGQLVIYPIVRLDALDLGVVDLIRGLAASLSGTLSTYDVDASYDPDHPGVWTESEPRRKVASVGMRVTRGVTTHGAAINLVNDMIPFSLIVPCGMPNAPMARLSDLTQADVSVDDFADRFLDTFKAFLDVPCVSGSVQLPAAHEWIAPLSDD